MPSIRRRPYVVADVTLGGDAPKNFVHIYEPRVGSRSDYHTWPAHIAKVGHKWYPAESITEQLMTRVGQCFGVEMADSTLMACGDQIRFLSRYFLQKDESLVHGAEIVAGYLGDEAFVRDVEQQKVEKDLFTFQVVCEAVTKLFPADCNEILMALVKMVGFDALVGNHDRHFYNWGVIVHPKAARHPRFSPVYDTARGLFWNTAESKLTRYADGPALQQYLNKARPQIGWDGEKNDDVNHFRLVDLVAGHTPGFRNALRVQASTVALKLSLSVIDNEFGMLLSNRRRECIKKCLTHRFERIQAVL